MKKQILKIAGVKSEKEFYKKFPDEASFMAKHGKAFKKAQIGAYIGGEQDAGFQPIAFGDLYDKADYTVTGSTEQMRKDEEARQAQIAAAQSDASGSGGGGGMQGIGQALQFLGSEEGMAMLAAARKGKSIKKAQGGDQIEPVPGDYPDYNSWKADWDLWSQNQRYVGMGGSGSGGTGAAPAPTGIKNPTLDIEEKQGSDLAKTLGKYAGPAGKLVQGIEQAKAEKKALQSAEQMRDVSALVRQAAGTQPEQRERRYLRPEDVTNTGEEFFPIYGVGTNVLAKNGASVGGGEIMNTFAPNTLYDDLGYEPLNDSERYKQFYFGGKMRTAENGDWMEGTGLYNFAQSGGTNATGQLLTSLTGQNAGGNIGGTIGSTAGTLIGGPVGGLIGQAAGQLIGAAIDRKPQKIKKAKEATQQNIQATALQQGLQGGQAQYTSFMQDGGTTSPYKWMSHTWQPQVIATFGEHKVGDLLRPPKDADMLRAGGHLKEYTPPSAAAMSTERPNFAMGGELKTHWGGYAEPMSYNPYLPEGGETVMFRGQSHDESDGKGNTGIGITYGDNPVEVERGEPAVKLKDGTGGDSSLVVFGNLKIPKAYIPFLGEDAKGKKFKTYVADLSKKENKINNKMSKATDELSELDVQTPFDRLKFNSLDLTIKGSNAKLKNIADKKMSAASLQNAINDTAEEYGLIADDLAQGRVKAAKYGDSLSKAQDGKGVKKTPSKLEAMKEVPKGQHKGKVYYGGITDTDVQEMKRNNPWYDWSTFDPSRVGDVKDFQKEFNKKAEEVGSASRLTVDDRLGQQTASAKGLYDNIPTTYIPPSISLKDIPLTPSTTGTPTTVAPVKITPYKRSGLLDLVGQVLPYIRPADQEELNAMQTAGEMYALATNQLEPVQAQTYQPELGVPYDISLQDILNENEAAFRSQQRVIGYNPALQAQLNAQKYAANQKVLGEQFRMNQAMKDQVYRENRNILNEAKLRNLAILDQQYVRQAEAKSKTKAVTQAALNSISDKYLRNQLENRTLATMENLFNFRYDPRFRTVNVNAPYQPNIPTVYTGPQGGTPVLDDQGNVIYVSQQAGTPSYINPIVPPPTQSSQAAPIEQSAQDIEMGLSPYQTADEIKESFLNPSGKYGAKVGKKKNLNSSIVRAMKNI